MNPEYIDLPDRAIKALSKQMSREFYKGTDWTAKPAPVKGFTRLKGSYDAMTAIAAFAAGYKAR